MNKNLIQPIKIEIDPEDYTDQYDEMLDEIHGEFMNMSASYILKECDPTAYRCGLLDYVDSMDIEPTYQCPVCGSELDDEYDAIKCCQSDFICPECDEVHETIEEVENCCKDDED